MTIKKLYEWSLANNAEDLTIMSIDYIDGKRETIDFHEVETDDHDGHKFVVLY